MTRHDRILCVDDNPGVRRLISRVLSGRFEVLTAADGYEALAILSGEEIDLAIIDVMMPVMDGKTLASRMRQEIPTCGIPILMLSALSSPDDREQGLDAGADSYITKPFELDRLRSAVLRLIAGHRA